MISSRTLWAVSAALAVAASVVACDLNPQPLPPGEQPDGSLNDNPGSGNGSGSGGGTGAGSSSGSSGSGSGGIADDSGTPPTSPADGGVSAVDGAAPLDAAGDAPADGASDAPIDAGEIFDGDAEAGPTTDAGDAG